MAEGNMKNGKKDGPWISWYQNGQKMAEVNWMNGKKDGLWIYRHNGGQKMGEEQWKDGEKISAKYWDSRGEKVTTLKDAQK